MVALDASALLARGTSPSTRFSTPRAFPPSTSLVLSRVVRDHIAVAEVLPDLERSTLEVVAFDAQSAISAAELLPLTRRAGLSLGDWACLALAMARSVPVLTADPAWADLGLEVDVVMIR